MLNLSCARNQMVSNGLLFRSMGRHRMRKKHEFLAELARICDNDSQPLLVGGDFNIIRRKEDKNNDNFDPRWPFMFNAIIESLDLREIALSGRQFTWAS